MDKKILDVVLESAKDLKLDKVTLREIEALKLAEVKVLTPTQIKRIRTKSKASQGVMAKLMNVGVTTVQKWERGDVQPNGAALKLLNIAYKNGLEILAS